MAPEQEKSLVRVEAAYRQDRTRLEGQLHDANVALAEIILAERSATPRVSDAIDHIHSVMGDLQKVTVMHVFEMKQALTPEQYDLLLRQTSDALRGAQAGHEH